MLLNACTHTLHRRDNALVLSEDLDEDAVQNLVDVALGDLFPEQCEEWLSIKQYIHEIFMQERSGEESAVARDIANAKDSLQHALREEVVDHVIKIFPYVLFQRLDHTQVFT
jgi:hypothetical protein